jgi:FlaA1/EpsC-like NDP-sugar epimerase
VEDRTRVISENVNALLEKEISKGLNAMAYYRGFQKKADQIKYDVLDFLIEQKKNKKKVVAYGAAAKGNTLINYCGVRKDLIAFVVDASPHKQGKYLPGSHIPVVNEEAIKKFKPDYVLILPWNLRDEVMDQLAYVSAWDGRFVTAVPSLVFIHQPSTIDRV